VQHGNTALMRAIAEKQYEVARLLLDKGANINSMNQVIVILSLFYLVRVKFCWVLKCLCISSAARRCIGLHAWKIFERWSLFCLDQISIFTQVFAKNNIEFSRDTPLPQPAEFCAVYS
jgi:ankyrin repeat protein